MNAEGFETVLTPCAGETITFAPSLEKGRRGKAGFSKTTNMFYKTLVSVHNLQPGPSVLESTSVRFQYGVFFDHKSHHAIQGSNKRKDQLGA